MTDDAAWVAFLAALKEAVAAADRDEGAEYEAWLSALKEAEVEQYPPGVAAGAALLARVAAWVACVAVLKESGAGYRAAEGDPRP